MVFSHCAHLLTLACLHVNLCKSVLAQVQKKTEKIKHLCDSQEAAVVASKFTTVEKMRNLVLCSGSLSVNAPCELNIQLNNKDVTLGPLYLIAPQDKIIIRAPPDIVIGKTGK